MQSGGADCAQHNFLGTSAPLDAEARETYGLYWLEYMEIRCCPNVILVGFVRNVQFKCFKQPEFGFNFSPNLVHLDNYPIQFRAASALVPADVWGGRIVQETNVSDGVCVRCPKHVPEQPC